jgi:hypothetical protein
MVNKTVLITGTTGQFKHLISTANSVSGQINVQITLIRLAVLL